MQDNTTCTSLTPYCLDMAMKDMAKRSKAQWEHQARIARDQQKYIKLFDWLKNNCSDELVLMIGELAIDCVGYGMPISLPWSEELKPWIDKYEAHLKEKERV